MNLPRPDKPQPGARPEGAVLRFLRWLIEPPPVEPQPANLRVIRWLLRAGAFLLYAAIDGSADGAGSGGGGSKGGELGDRPERNADDRSADPNSAKR